MALAIVVSAALPGCHGFGPARLTDDSPAATPRGWTQNHCLGPFHVGEPVRVEVAEENLKTFSVHFRKSMRKVRATIRVRYLSRPKARWQITLALLDPRSTILREAQRSLENTGGGPSQASLHTQEEIFDLGAWRDVSKATRFAVTLRSISPEP